jgi:hypothetical protein
MLMAVIISAAVFGSIIVLIQNFDITGAKFKRRIDLANEEFRLNKVPVKLWERITTYYDLLTIR